MIVCLSVKLLVDSVLWPIIGLGFFIFKVMLLLHMIAKHNSRILLPLQLTLMEEYLLICVNCQYQVLLSICSSPQ